MWAVHRCVSVDRLVQQMQSTQLLAAFANGPGWSSGRLCLPHYCVSALFVREQAKPTPPHPWSDTAHCCTDQAPPPRDGSHTHRHDSLSRATPHPSTHPSLLHLDSVWVSRSRRQGKSWHCRQYLPTYPHTPLQQQHINTESTPHWTFLSSGLLALPSPKGYIYTSIRHSTRVGTAMAHHDLHSSSTCISPGFLTS